MTLIEHAGRFIKFRFWDTSQERMFSWEQVREEYAIGAFLKALTDERHISMQFSGLHDKDGREICEGDIALRDGEQWMVEWNAEDAGFWFAEPNGKGKLNIGATCEEAEVVGHIFENADMLKPSGNLPLL